MSEALEEKAFHITLRDISLISNLRYVMRENQTQFWRRFGANQSFGSRVERGGAIPFPMLMLIRLYLLGIINDEDLARVSAECFEDQTELPPPRRLRS